ncbi:ATP-dependent 6-phosphofructokinase subunit beta [Nakaseomyces glabratus]|nr:ATP-dependent 6-phosphofructokinase subunit beta [Nakaseomyces glabratus]KTB26579.1 ATP-dependent 6-phosphofructokinase subunit beta [Nakaseomyces glabratus]
MTAEALVNGTSYTTLVAHSQESFKNAVEFYKNFLSLMKLNDKNANEATLYNSSVCLKIVLEEDSSKNQAAMHRVTKLSEMSKKQDWRAQVKDSLVFNIVDIQSIQKSLIANNFPIQAYPTTLQPMQLFTIDPLGNVVGVTCTKNAASTRPTKPQADVTTVPPSALASNVPSALPSKVQSFTDLSYCMKTTDHYPSLPTKATRVTPESKKAIAVMTSGGDAPGMNSNVRAIVRSALFKGCRAFVVMEGYEGLVRGGPEYIKEFSWEDVRGWSTQGGTNIGTARCMEFRERKGRLLGAQHLIEAGVDALIVCGGDGSLTGADLFRSEWPSLIDELLKENRIDNDQYERYKHLNICGTVGSIDNDMSTTDATIGAYSALDRICTAIDYVEATANSHSRAFVVEVMGRNCGWLALLAGIATSADYIFIPEKPATSSEWQDQMCDIVAKHRSRGKRTTIVIVAEGAIANDLTPISPSDVHKVLCDRLGLDTRITTLGHVQRGGTAVAYDRILATLQGIEAVNAVLESKPDTQSPLIAINENKITRKPLVESVKLTKSVADAIQAKDFKKAMSLRDTEFIEHMKNFMAINSADHNEPKLSEDKRLKIAIVNVGAPAGGINSVVYSMATYCMSQGHKPYAIYNGFSGLARHESVRSLKWQDMLGWQSRGGSEIGTNRVTPEEADLGMVAYYFQKYQFDGLILVGGFEAFESLHQLERARETYPAFRIPMVLIPATLSNNVPGTEYSLGSDTALNALMEYCDIVKQSASSTRGRAFVVDVQGGNSGYLATYAALAVGAQVSYVPEEGISLEQLSQDIEYLAESFEVAQGREGFGKLILKSTNASKALTAEKLAEVITAEANGRFDAKAAYPGHVQQGGLPSPIDRTRATRFAIRAVDFIEEQQSVIANARAANDVFVADDKDVESTATVLGVKGSQIVFSSIRQLYDFETEVGKRMPKVIHWQNARAIADHLVGRKRVD